VLPAEQAHCLFSHTSGPFFSGSFGNSQSGPGLRASYFMFPTIGGMTGECHHPWPFPLRWGPTNIFAWPVLEQWSSTSQTPKYLGLWVWASGTWLTVHFDLLFFKCLVSIYFAVNTKILQIYNVNCLLFQCSLLLNS
jgi:hypothetical protein